MDYFCQAPLERRIPGTIVSRNVSDVVVGLEGDAYVSMRPLLLHAIGSKRVRRCAAPPPGVTPYKLFQMERPGYTVTGTGNLYFKSSLWDKLFLYSIARYAVTFRIIC